MNADSKPLFHRIANSSSQSVRDAVRQNKTGELWGKGAFGGLPAALAYIGRMDDDEQGTQFSTAVSYAKNGHPEWAYWYLPEDGGDGRIRRIEQDDHTYACLEIEPNLNRYRCK